MFNKKVLKCEKRKEVLELLNLQENYDKFNNTTVVAPAKLGIEGLADTFKLTQGFGSRNVSEVLFMRSKIDGKWSHAINWKFIMDESDQVLDDTNWITGLKFLFYAGDVEAIKFEKKTLGAEKVVSLSEELLLKLIRAETLEIRVETNQKVADYPLKKCKQFQLYLKEFYEKFLDLEEYDNLQANGSLESARETAFAKPKKDNQSKSKFGVVIKWWLIITIVLGIVAVVFDKKDGGSNKNSSQSSSAPVQIPTSQQDEPKNQSSENNNPKTESDSTKKE